MVNIRHQRSHRSTGVALAALLCLSLLPASSAADTQAELDAAEARLGTLQANIVAQERDANRLKRHLDDLTGQVGQQQDDLASVQQQLRRTQQRLGDTRAEISELRTRISDRARRVYMQGPLAWLDLLFGARDLTDFSAGVHYAARVVRDDAETTSRMRVLAAELEAQEAAEEQLARAAAERLQALQGERRAIEAAFTEQQAQLADLARARAELGELVERLADRLRAERLAAARAVAARGTPLTFEEWGRHFLSALGAPITRNNLVVVVTWQAAEYTQAAWNPLATTYRMPGSTTFNSHGVQNFTSLEQGITATIRTLRLSGHGYQAIVANLTASSEPMTTARAINASNWCRGCVGGNYVTGLIPTVEAHYERYAGQ